VAGQVNAETQTLELTMRDLAILREALIPKLEALRAAVEPFGLNTTWEAETRLVDVLGKVTVARCDLKRRNPAYNPVGDPECENEATDAEIEAWEAAHPEPFSEPSTES
jgi:hypothetical protein